MPQLASEIAQSYNSFSGSDIRAVIGNTPFAELQGVSYSVTREKVPVYTMGSADVRSFSRSKRGVAGSLVWVNFDRHALLDVIKRNGGKFVSDIDEIRPPFRILENDFLGQTAIFSSSIRRGNDFPLTATLQAQRLTSTVSEVQGHKALANAWYADQVLPFDITLTAANEYGAAATMKIFGVEILNEGSGVSIDDAVNEMQATFVARLVEPWLAVASKWPNGPERS